jgi:transposase
VGEDSLYRNLDKLHPRREKIEAALARRERHLFNLSQTVFLYDLTATYFEGQALANPQAKRGYSRDRRPDCKQVVVGLVLNREGFPLAHEVFASNVRDGQTLGPMLDLLAARVGLAEGQLVVVDRGMASNENLLEITARQLHYLVAARQGERDRWLAEFEDEEGFTPAKPVLADQEPQVWVKKQGHGEETLVLCLSAGRREKDRAIRLTHQQRLERDLKKLAHRLSQGRLVQETKISEAIGRLKERYPRVARYYQIGYDPEAKELRADLDEAKLSQAERLDGSYLLKTSRPDLKAPDLWQIYRLLTRVENAFRIMKSPLAERPIFHHLEHRVETHIFLCVLAYHLVAAIEKTLTDQGVQTSWATVRDTLRTHQVATVVLPAEDGSVFRIRKASKPESHHVELYKLLKVPCEVMRPKKTFAKAPGV